MGSEKRRQAEEQLHSTEEMDRFYRSGVVFVTDDGDGVKLYMLPWHGNGLVITHKWERQRSLG